MANIKIFSNSRIFTSVAVAAILAGATCAFAGGGGGGGGGHGGGANSGGGGMPYAMGGGGRSGGEMDMRGPPQYGGETDMRGAPQYGGGAARYEGHSAAERLLARASGRHSPAVQRRPEFNGHREVRVGRYDNAAKAGSDRSANARTNASSSSAMAGALHNAANLRFPNARAQIVEGRGEYSGPRHRHGWAGPLFWPFATHDIYDYTLRGSGYDDRFWDYGYGEIYAGIFSPYSYDDLAAYEQQEAGPGPDAGPQVNARPPVAINEEPPEPRAPLGAQRRDAVNAQPRDAVTTHPHVAANPPPDPGNALPHDAVNGQRHVAATAQPHVAATAQPHVAVTAQPDPANALPRDAVNAQANVAADPQSDPANALPRDPVNAQAHVAADPQPDPANAQPHDAVNAHGAATAQPRLAATAQPHAAVNARPHDAANAQPHSAVNARAHDPVNAEPKAAANAQPRDPVNAEPKVAANAQPRDPVNVEPKAAVNAPPRGAVNAEPKVALNVPAHGAVNAETRGPQAPPSGRLAQMCSEDSRDIAGMPIDPIQAAIAPNDVQRAALDDLANASVKAAAIIRAACPTQIALTAPGRLTAMRQRVEAMISAAGTVQPALQRFYDQLSDEQKTRLKALAGDQPRTDAANNRTGLPAAGCSANQATMAEWPNAEIEARLHLTEAQRGSLADLQDATARAQQMLRESCPTGDQAAVTPPARLDAVHKRLEVILIAVKTVRAALDDFYAGLSDEQKAQFEAIGQHRAAASDQPSNTRTRVRHPDAS
jgi:LTXXQ motif family protein